MPSLIVAELILSLGTIMEMAKQTSFDKKKGLGMMIQYLLFRLHFLVEMVILILLNPIYKIIKTI